MFSKLHIVCRSRRALLAAAMASVVLALYMQASIGAIHAA